MPKIIDVITYNGEQELFDLRYNILKDYVDEFRVIEFDQTFSGKPKPQLFTQNLPKVKTFYVKEDVWSKYLETALRSPNTQYGMGAEHWVREFCQKESIKDCLADLNDDDLVYIGDCDEIYKPFQPKGVEKLKLLVYTYWLNNQSNEEFWGTIAGKWKYMKDQSLNYLRTRAKRTIYDWGWHFTSLAPHLQQKLTDSYTKETYANDFVLQNLERNIKENKDFLGRDFKYWINEEDWPNYLKNNKEKYKHLIKENNQ